MDENNIILYFRPSIDRNLKPNTNLLSDGGLRNVIVPRDTMQRFLGLAYNNTSHNIETCGILAGQLVLIYINVCLVFNNFIVFSGTKPIIDYSYNSPKTKRHFR